MTWSVRWSATARNALAQIWLDGDTTLRASLTRAVSSIDRVLLVDPGEQGESRDQGRRVLFVPPIVIIFRVVEAQRTVLVVNVRPVEHKGRN